MNSMHFIVYADVEGLPYHGDDNVVLSAGGVGCTCREAGYEGVHYNAITV